MKKTLAKARQHDASIRHTSITSPKSASKSASSSSSSKHSSRDPISLSAVTSAKKPRLDSKSNGNKDGLQSDMSRSLSGGDFSGVAICQLKEQIASLQKQLSRKDQELLEKDKKVCFVVFCSQRCLLDLCLNCLSLILEFFFQIAEMTAKWRTDEKHLRDRLLVEQKKLTEKTESYQQKIVQLQKQNATLSKQSKKPMIKQQDSPMDSPII
jgi:hypothetical protein